MSENAPPKTKYVLECVGLLVTIVGGIVGTVIALRSSTPAAPPAIAQAEPSNSSEPNRSSPPVRLASAGIATSTPSTPAPKVASVDVSGIRDAAKLQSVQQENTAKIGSLMASFLQQVTDATPKVLGYDTNQQACVVDVALAINPQRYVDFLAAAEPLLQLDSQLAGKLNPTSQAATPSAPLTISLTQDRGGPKLDYGTTASADARQLLESFARTKTKRGVEAFPSLVMTVVPTASGTARVGEDLNARVWRVTPATGKSLYEAFVAASEAKLRVELADATGASLASLTRPTALPHAGTWKADRFVVPAALLGDRNSISRGQLSPIASQRNAHRRDGEGRQLLGLLPGFCSAPQRIDGEKKTATPELTSTVTYRFAIPMSADNATQISKATATISL